MKRQHFALIVAAAITALVVSSRAQQTPSQNPGGSEPPFRFRSGVELINVTATVYDATGRFVPGLTQDDFIVYDDDQRVDVTHFNAERVPVSLGIALDSSGSMYGEKMSAARGAISRFVDDLLEPDDELFLYRFSNYPELVQGWTHNRREIVEPLARIFPNGATALYDAVARALPLAQRGQNPKKALVVISDGNDTSSRTYVQDLKRQIRESEVLVYAVGIDSDAGDDQPARRAPMPPPVRLPIPVPFPGGPRGRFPQPQPQPPSGGTGGGWRSRSDDRVNAAALREITDDSGGRTEIVRDPRDLDPATASIADELSKQYYLGYASLGRKDGRWHAIRVEVRNRSYRVRARRGYIAS
jgi:Ca-activated chloride channel family protein